MVVFESVQRMSALYPTTTKQSNLNLSSVQSDRDRIQKQVKKLGHLKNIKVEPIWVVWYRVDNLCNK